MKQLVLTIMITTQLFSFEFDFSLPPVLEEVFEPSVLGEEVRPAAKEKPVEKKEIKENEGEDVTTIYVGHRSEQTFSPDIEFSTYPKIALLVPSKVIGKFANSMSDSLLSYLIFKDSKFQFELFDSVDESEENIVRTLREVRHKGYQLVIAAVTQKGARAIVKYEQAMQVYIPTINKKEINLQSDNISFGGIDYEEQIDRLLTHSGERVAIFGDTSALSKRLENYVDNASFSEISYRKTIKNVKANLTPFIKKNHALKDASIFLNMPIVKTSLLASQLNVNDAAHKNILLTQISYNPLLFTLTQYQDREVMFIANSIGRTDFRLKDINLILGINLDFAWVNYSTLIGIDYLVNNFIDSSERKMFSEKMVNNQIRYNIEILKPSSSRFERIKH